MQELLHGLLGGKQLTKNSGFSFSALLHRAAEMVELPLLLTRTSSVLGFTPAASIRAHNVFLTNNSSLSSCKLQC